jgi:hypothetical protein
MRPTTPLAPSAPSVPNECPRCAYDLSGTVARWTAACDLHGTCPECGLEFPWGDILNPERAVPRWFYEAARGRPPLLLLRTAARALRPRRFWSAINMALRIRSHRLVVLVLVALAISHVLVGAASCANLALELAPTRRFATKVTLDISQSGMYTRVMLWPYSYPPFRGSAQYAMPATANRPAITTPFVFTIGGSGAVGAHMLTPLLATGIMPLTYLLLRQTMRRTRIRRAHLFRIFAYSALMLPIFVSLHILGWPSLRDQYLSMRGAFRTRPTTLDTLVFRLNALDAAVRLPLLLLGLQITALSIWWHAATTRYLRLPHAAGVVLAMLTITSLVVCLMLVTTGAWKVYWRP